MHKFNKNNLSIAKKLRNNATTPEKILWNKLKNSQLNGIKFRRQQPIGPYIVDFASFYPKIVIELDGGQHNNINNLNKDVIRDNFLTNEGFLVLRIWNNDIYTNLEGTMEYLKKETSPTPESKIQTLPSRDGKTNTTNETKSFKATFPDDYDNESVKGQTVEFEVTVTGLATTPIFNDDFVKAYFPEYKTTTEFTTALKERYILSNIYEYITSNSKVIKYPKAELRDATRELEDIEDTFKAEYGVELDAYIEAYFDMTREEYIKSNMKSEMIYYAIKQRENIEPTNEQLLEEVDELIEYYKNYYMENENLDEITAKAKAKSFVNDLGSTYSYENVLFRLVDEFLTKAAKVTEKPRTYTSITEIRAEADKPVTE